MLHPQPLGVPLRKSAMVNLGAACYLIADQMPGALSPDEDELYGSIFQCLRGGRLSRFLALGVRG